eukprot:gene2495-2798_t
MPKSATELSNSFIITSFQDLESQSINGRTMSPCQYAVSKARSVGGKHFSIVVTAYWAGGQHQVSHYAFKDVSGAYAGGYGFPEPNSQNILRWKRGLQACFRSAVKAGFTGIQILNHIDSTEPQAWRNFVDVDPLVKYGGWSYEDVVVRPAADAIRTVTRPSTKIWFMLAGEMGRSLFKHPTSYMKLIGKYRGTLARGKVGTNVKVGLALHWNKVCGDCFYMPYTENAAQYNATYGKAFAEQQPYIKANYNKAAIKRVFEVSDVLGISHYAPMPLNSMTPASFELPFMTTAYELRLWGIDLRNLVWRSNKDFLFSEVGLGGAASDRMSLAQDLNMLSKNVENGIWAVYNTRQDPWQRPDYREYRRIWFQNLLGFLRHGGSHNVRIAGAFVWSVGSFDVAGVHPISSSSEGTYADSQIVGWMKRLSAATT